MQNLFNVCPAFADISNKQIVFNNSGTAQQFEVRTTSRDNVTPNQKFTTCKGKSIYCDIEDDFSPSDSPNGFAPYPLANHINGSIMTVEQFVATY